MTILISHHTIEIKSIIDSSAWLVNNGHHQDQALVIHQDSPKLPELAPLEAGWLGNLKRSSCRVISFALRPGEFYEFVHLEGIWDCRHQKVCLSCGGKSWDVNSRKRTGWTMIRSFFLMDSIFIWSKSKKTGGLKEQKFTTADSDHDFCSRARLAGWRIPVALAIHVVAEIDRGDMGIRGPHIQGGPQHVCWSQIFFNLLCVFSMWISVSQASLYPNCLPHTQQKDMVFRSECWCLVSFTRDSNQ